MFNNNSRANYLRELAVKTRIHAERHMAKTMGKKWTRERSFYLAQAERLARTYESMAAALEAAAT